MRIATLRGRASGFSRVTVSFWPTSTMEGNVSMTSICFGTISVMKVTRKSVHNLALLVPSGPLGIRI